MSIMCGSSGQVDRSFGAQNQKVWLGLERLVLGLKSQNNIEKGWPGGGTRLHSVKNKLRHKQCYTSILG